jgi:hypothetical protein
MEKSQRLNAHFDAAEFIEELTKVERRAIKKEDSIKKCGYNIKDSIPIKGENKLRDQEIESLKKIC